MSQNFEVIRGMWERKITEQIGTASIIEKICKEELERQERVFRQHMTKTEQFIFDHIKNKRIKKFALRKFRVEEDRSEPMTFITRFYKDDELIDTIKYVGTVKIKGAYGE